VLQFLWGLGAWNWIVLAVLLLVLETVVPGVHFLWFGLAAGIVGALALAVGPEFTWQWQLIAYALVAVATVFLVRRTARPDANRSDVPDLNVRAQQYVGRVFRVEEPIAGGRGKLRVGDTLWPAQGPDAPKGASVKVTGTNGTVLVVELAAASAQ
jgi:membrane protein implicated in regulation of membrane protease activity